MFTRSLIVSVAAAACAALAATACSSSGPTAPAMSASVASVAPAGGASAVSTSTTITVMFTDSMMTSMSAYMSLHQGTLSGPAVPMNQHWSADHKTLTMTPTAPLASGTTFYIHMGGGMTGANGEAVGYGQCAGLGGQSATSSMMGGMMGGMSGEMGSGWMGSDGNYGWIFSFATA